ncbi:MAG: hypothetical protein JWR10_3978 [Rubritepida sp.]|nr:hypothetical protein [Rubritepida sp.]
MRESFLSCFVNQAWSSLISGVLRSRRMASPSGGAAEDPALNVQQHFETPHGLKRDRIDRLRSLAPRFPARGALDVRKRRICAGRGRSSRLRAPAQRPRLPPECIEIAIASIAVGLEDAVPGSEVGSWMLAAPSRE